MYSIDELKQQNKEISQLCEVLSTLIEKPELYKNPVVDDLLSRFKEKVWIHLVFEDNTIYAGLLKSDDQDTINKAQTFHDSAKVIKHHFSDFIKHLRTTEASTTTYQTFHDDCSHIFQLIKARIDYENNEIFPLIG